MVLRHATPRRNLESIQEHGILRRYSLGKRKVVWLHDEDKTPWAILHTCARHGCSLDEVVVLEVEVYGEMVVNHGRGLMYYIDDVSPIRIKRVIKWVEVAMLGSVADA